MPTRNSLSLRIGSMTPPSELRRKPSGLNSSETSVRPRCSINSFGKRKTHTKSTDRPLNSKPSETRWRQSRRQSTRLPLSSSVASRPSTTDRASLPSSEQTSKRSTTRSNTKARMNSSRSNARLKRSKAISPGSTTGLTAARLKSKPQRLIAARPM